MDDRINDLYKSKLIDEETLLLLAADLSSIYSPLATKSTIRILHLYPGKDDDPILCRLLHQELDSPEQFMALSYAWGDPKVTRPIAYFFESFSLSRMEMDTSINIRRMDVTVNLYNALRRVRHPTNLEPWWIDAICINQTNNEEKSHQVNMMNEIYARAYCVQIWLGEVALTGETLKCIGEAHTYFFPAEVRRLFLQPHADINFSNYCHGLRARGLPTIFDMDLSPLGNLLQSPWWRRKWVIQEAVRAQRLLVVFGKAKVPFEVIMSLFERLALSGVDVAPGMAPFEYTPTDELANPDISYHCARIIHGLRHPYKREDAGPTLLLELIGRTQYFQCSDMRDHIYAMLGLNWQRENEEFTFHPDYSESPEATFIRFAIQILRVSEHPLHLLFFNSDLGTPTNLKLPSWVPDWTRLGKGQRLKSFLNISGTPLFRATKNTSLQLKLNESELILSFTGVRLDVIKANATTHLDSAKIQAIFNVQGSVRVCYMITGSVNGIKNARS